MPSTKIKTSDTGKVNWSIHPAQDADNTTTNKLLARISRRRGFAFMPII
jgi:hypothetical protein